MSSEDYHIRGRHNAIEDRRLKKARRRITLGRSQAGVIVVHCAIAVGRADLHEVIEDVLLRDAYPLDLDGEQVNVGGAGVVRGNKNVWATDLWVPCEDVSVQGLTRREAEIIPNGMLASLSHTLQTCWQNAGLTVTHPRKPYELTLVGVA